MAIHKGSITKIGAALRPNRWIFFLPESERMGISDYDLPANFQVADPYLIVDLDEACRLNR